jgi:hypothetical protein
MVLTLQPAIVNLRQGSSPTVREGAQSPFVHAELGIVSPTGRAALGRPEAYRKECGHAAPAGQALASHGTASRIGSIILLVTWWIASLIQT